MICLFFFAAALGCGSNISYPSGADGSTSPTTFSASQFGVKGDGVANDAPAIQRALNAANTAGGGQVTFGCGNFWIGSVAGAAPASRSLLYLKNATGVQVVGQGSCTHLFTAVPQKSILEFEDSSAISVTAMRMTGLNANYIETYGMGGGSAVRFTGVSHGTIANLEVDGATAGALYLTKGSSYSTVANNYVHDTYGAAIWEDDCGSASATSCAPSTPPQHNVYQSNTFTNTSLAMLAAITLDDGGGSSYASVKGNTVSWTHPALPSNPKVHCIQIGNTADASIVNNSCTGTPWDAIAVTTANGAKSQRIVIQGNTLTSTGGASAGGSGVVVYDDPVGGGISAISILYNTISVAQTDGIRLYAASRPGGVSGVMILNNQLHMVDQQTPGTRFGIDVEYSAQVTVGSNTIDCNGKCIAAGVNIHSSTGTAPTPTANTVTNIVGVPLAID